MSHEIDEESGELDDENVETTNESKDNNGSLGINDLNNIKPSSRADKKNDTKSNSSLKDVPNIPGDSS